MRSLTGEMTVTDYAPGTMMPMHAHGYSKVSIVLYGSAIECWKGQEKSIAPGFVLTKPSGFEHSDLVGTDGLRILSIRTSACSQISQSAWQQVVSKYRHLSLDPSIGRLLKAWIKQEVETSDAIEETVLALADVSEIRDRYVSDRAHWSRTAINILCDRLSQPPSLTDLGLEIGVHPVSLAKALRVRTGYTKTELVYQMRIQRSLVQLAGSKRVDGIAYELGFSDAAHFCRVFKRWMGCSAREYCENFCNSANPVQLGTA